MADYRLSGSAAAQIDQILSWSQDKFGDQARERYAALLVTVMEDVADDPEQVTVDWKRLARIDVGVYHISHSRDHVLNPPGPVGDPRHYSSFAWVGMASLTSWDSSTNACCSTGHCDKSSD